MLAQLVQADSGFWAWGRGHARDRSITPAAIIDFGFSDEQRGVVIEWGLSADANQNFTQRVLATMNGATQATTLCQDIFTPAEWNSMPVMRAQLARGGWENWLHSVRYSAHDTWSNLFLLRDIGKADFGPSEATLVDLVMTNVSWLHSTAEESLPPETFVGLKPRQRTVMLMLLDGLHRKAIASQLGITEDTVGDHIKAIYSHFRIGSATELAALFLRSK